ncbi:hypothetical protein PV327_010970 [Microctonus hyperodae]|uniref:Telomere-associated protein Rif1 N-terminal domain-containing protein n=1 Tax=Microctonus hyperodae TaxID=165561 RepID=A0AA39FRS8_MICHY|nr:hypothetical protein PV327_010970 [Microctonus hyperodae]
MTMNCPRVEKILGILRDESMVAKHASVLTYLRSDIAKVKLKEQMNDTQIVELCKELVAQVSKSNKHEKNTNFSKRSEETKITLQSFLKNFANDDLKFFKIISRINRRKRLRIFEVLNSIEIDVLLLLMKDSMSINFINDCLQMVQPNSMEWLGTNACTDSIQPLIEVQTQILTDEQYNEEQLINHTLTMIHRLYEHAVNNSSNLNIELIHPLIFERVIPLAYMGHKRQRTPALVTLNQALNTNLISYIKDKHFNLWTQFKQTLSDTYCRRISLLVKAVEHDWSQQWCLSIKMLGTDLHRGAELINNLLNVEEKAFKSPDMAVRKEAFESWKYLIDNFALDPAELATSRRIKLLCIPLNAKNSKTEMIAVSKLETWWHLIAKLYPNVDKLLNQVIGQFLNFCFGPLGDTPLLSTKCDVVASPGKRFHNTKLLAVDALLQLLIQESMDRLRIPCFIKERIPTAVSSVVFQECYKSFFHCVSEAVLMIHELKENELNNRDKLNEMLWSNLLLYIQQSSSEQKSHMYKELLFIVDEVINHITDSSSIIHSLFNVIVNELVKVTQHFTYRGTTLMNLLLKFLSPVILKNADKKNSNYVIHLISHIIKPKNVDVYHVDTLTFIKSVLAKMGLLIEHEMNLFIHELWCALAELMIQYMADDKQINEGTGINHNFEAIQLLITFPIQNIFWQNTEKITKMIKLWRELYIQFEIKADLITTVQPNEILDNFTKIMKDSLIKNKKCYNLIALSLDALTSTINYETLLSKNNIPPLITLLRDIIIVALTEMNENTIESSLKVTSSILITVYGLSQTHALIYLDVLKPSIEHMLEFEYAVSVEKEIINTWEIVVIILRGLAQLLTHEFILSYQKAIILALCHKNNEISVQAMSLIDIKNNLNEEVKVLFDEFEKVAQNKLQNRQNSEQKNNDDSIKHVKITGSFLNRKVASPRTVISTTKDNEKKKKSVVTLPPPPEPDSQDYVVIKNDVKLDINRLTEHQKESLRRHRDDIPAMYNDLSQSASHNIQLFENFFGNHSSGTNEEKNENENINANILTNSEANKENNVTSHGDTINNKNEKQDALPVKKTEEEKINSIIETNQVKNNIELETGTETQVSLVVDDRRNLIEKIADAETVDSFIPKIIPKKLNFTSDDELLNESDNAKRFSQSKSEESCKQHQQQEIINNIGSKTDDDDDDAGSQSLELSHSVKRGCRRSKTSKVNEKSLRSTRLSNNYEGQSEQNRKRKATSKYESERSPINKRRRYTISSYSSSDTLSDPESINSMEGGNNHGGLVDENLPKRTKKEMSRLQINMVFDNKMPSKLRSKSVGENIHDNNSKRKINKNYSDKNIVPNSSSQKLIKKHKRKNISSSTEVNIESLKIQKLNISSEYNSVKEVTEKLSSIKNTQDNDACNNLEISNQDHSTENSSPINRNRPSKPVDDEEEVVENSQKTNTLIRSPHRRKHGEQLQIDSWMKTSPKKIIADGAFDNTSPRTNSNCQQIENNQKSLPEESNKLITPDSIFMSPKSNKVSPKSKPFMACRGAHMLGLVTKLAIGEKNKSSDKIESLENEISKKFKLSKESENDGSSTKKERTSILKEPDRIGSPSGSRQEKIFKNMKSNDCVSSPPKRFSKLKNDGEKISPKFEKTMSQKCTKTSKKGNDTEGCMLDEKDELPILEWSNSNPPSLTASPSISILKRQRQTVLDADNDVTPSKRKRVSFADPPVSREMGYEVMSGVSDVPSKSGQFRSLADRADTPIKIKQPKVRTIQIDIENSDQLLDDTSNIEESLTTDGIDISHTENDLLSEASNKLKDKMENCDITNTFADNSSKKIEKVVDDTVIIDNVNSIDETNVVETLSNSHTISNNNELKINTPHQLFKRKTDDSDDLLAFNITDDIARSQVLKTSDNNSKPSGLEDTIDIQNISNLNFTVDSDELCCSKLPRTSTQIDSMTTMAHCDTLPVTDSMFLSGIISQGSLPTQQSLILSQPHTMDGNNSICPTLSDCKEPINPIINSLVDPLWVKNLSNYFALHGIKTIGDLAQLSEREVARFPVKGKPKVDYIKQVLDKFSLSHSSSLERRITKKNESKISEADKKTPNMNQKNAEIVDDIFDLNTHNNKDDENNDIAVMKKTSSPINQALSDDSITEKNIETTKELLEKNVITSKVHNYGSVILDTSISPVPKHSVVIDQTTGLNSPTSTVMNTAVTTTDHPSTLPTKSEEAENIERVLNEIDPIILLQNAMKRNKIEDIIAQYKIKMQQESEVGKLTKEKIEILEPNIYPETEFKNACLNYGLTKVLEYLPTVFNMENQFFTKVLNTYGMSIPEDEYLNALDLSQIKKAISKKCSSSELCEMLSNVLINEDKNGINTPLTEVSNLSTMLKRMPVDSIISHTITNNELIPSSSLLEIALQNNNCDTITRTLATRFPNVTESIINDNVSADAFMAYINKSQLSKDKLLDIYRLICDKLNPGQLLDAHNEIMKKKLSFLDTDKLQ